MKILSYLSFPIGIIIFSLVFILKLNGFIGFLTATIGFLLIITAFILNKKLRELLFNILTFFI